MNALTQAVINQKYFYNGHGQLEISSLPREVVLSILAELEEYKGGTFTLEQYSDGGGSLYEKSGISDGVDKLWLSVEELT